MRNRDSIQKPRVKEMGKLSIEEMRDFSHFSHEHPLELTNLWPQGHTVCSGCKMSIVAGKDYYTCKPCSYYLHSTCYNLPRLIQHPADPNHDLNLVPSASFDCKACGLRGSGFSYNCSFCLVHYHTYVPQCHSQKHTVFILTH